jgi:1-acyl-sn-glycerol-3-phosphate acyltransferase
MTLTYRLFRFLARIYFKLMGGFEVLHQDRVPDSGPVILASNHVSFADPPACGAASARSLRFMAQAELFKPPVFGPLIRALGAFPIRRGEADTEAIRTALDTMAKGGALVVFPEGSRGDGRKLSKPLKGLALIAKKSGAQVVPVAVCGSFKMLPKGAKFPRRSKIKVIFGRPFTYASVAVQTSQEPASEQFGTYLMSEIQRLLAEGGEHYELWNGSGENASA